MPDGTTPTEYEIRRSLRNWRRSKRPEVMVYFGFMPSPGGARTTEELEQRKKVIGFRDELRQTAVAHEFADTATLRNMVRAQLENWLEQKRARLGAFHLIVSSTVPLVRTSGVAERIGDILLNIPAGPSIPTSTAGEPLTVEVSVGLNVNVTNRRDLDDIELVTCFGQRVRATRTSISSIAFRGVVLPGSTFGGGLWSRISGIRANVAQLGATRGAEQQISAFVQTRSAAAPVPIEGSNVVAIAQALEGYSVKISVCEGDQYTQSDAGWKGSYRVEITEHRFGTFGDSFGEAGRAQGTRFILRIFDLPRGVDLRIHRLDSRNPENPKAVLVDGAQANGDGGETALPGSQKLPLEISGGFAFAVWEFVDSGLSLHQATAAPRTIWLCFDLSRQIAVPNPVGKAKVSCDLAPLTANFNSSSHEATPRFIEWDSPSSLDM